jgi:magnesium-transporting ATPase (P-type)
VFEIPFNSVRKWHLVIGRKVGTTNNSVVAMEAETAATTYTLMMKGAPEVLIKICGFYAGQNGTVQINDAFNLDFQDAYMHFGNEGGCVLELPSTLVLMVLQIC